MENDLATERHLDQIRDVLIRDEELPLGLVPRLEAAVRRDQAAHPPLGWEVRLGIACVCFVAFGLWSQAVMSALLAGILALIALLYPWATFPECDSQAARPEAAS